MNRPKMPPDFKQAFGLWYFGIAGFALLLMMTSCVNSNNAEKKVLTLLDKCPSWTRLRPNDQPDREKIMASLEKIRTFNTRVVRMAVEQYVVKNTKTTSQNLENLSKVFLLNRYLFQVPQFVPAESPVFGAWRNPIEKGQMNVLWPFLLKPNGRLELTGVFSGYTGEPYQPIKEFDYFFKTFGIRK